MHGKTGEGAEELKDLLSNSIEAATNLYYKADKSPQEVLDEVKRSPKCFKTIEGAGSCDWPAKKGRERSQE